MQERKVTIVNKLGLHARAAAKFVQLASGFAADITVTRENKEVNGKSIMGVMMLAAGKGTEINLVADGSDEESAVEKLEQLVSDRFGEAE